ncbi:MAG: hypothetical protein ABFS42_16420, partial [Candidatus Krumholzibacteriota bacterium]
ILMVISGVMLHSLYRFDGTFGITEGQHVLDEESHYFFITKGALSREPAGKFALTLQDIDRKFPVKDATTEAARVHLKPLKGGAPVEGLLRINQPFLWGGIEFHYGALTGYSPEILVMDSAGGVVFRRFMRMKVRKSGDEWIHADFIELEDSHTRIEVQIIEGDRQESPQRRQLSVSRGDSILFVGEVAAADTVVAGALRVAVPRIRNWCYLHAVRNPWLWMVFTGFWVGLAGLTITVLPRTFPRKGHRS